MAGSHLEADLWINEYITPWDIYAHGITKVLAYQKTAFQEMYIVESGAYGKALVLDGKWQSCTGDEFIYHEVLVQPGMIAHGNPKTALVLGGGEGATIREILRWQSIERVVMIDIDGEVVAACQEHLPEMHQGAFEDPRIELKIADICHSRTNPRVSSSSYCSSLGYGISSQFFRDHCRKHCRRNRQVCYCA